MYVEASPWYWGFLSSYFLWCARRRTQGLLVKFFFLTKAAKSEFFQDFNEIRFFHLYLQYSFKFLNHHHHHRPKTGLTPRLHSTLSFTSLKVSHPISFILRKILLFSPNCLFKISFSNLQCLKVSPNIWALSFSDSFKMFSFLYVLIKSRYNFWQNYILFYYQNRKILQKGEPFVKFPPLKKGFFQNISMIGPFILKVV